MEEIQMYINKQIQQKYLTLFFILDEIAQKETIISFTFKDNVLMVQTGVNDFYRIDLNSEEVKS